MTIELRASAGLTCPLADPKYPKYPKYKVDPVVSALAGGPTGASRPLARFPYLGVPCDGYHNPS